MEAGPTDANNVDVTAADNNPLHVIPVAIGAIATLIHLPDGCTGFGATTPLYGQRPKVTLEALENVWYGTGTTWADLIPTLPAAGCGDQPIKRVVRKDSSGSTFAFKQLMANIAPAHAAEWRALNNQLWPTNGTAIRPTATGGGALASYVGLATNPGTIGYVDLATARTNSNATFTYVDGTFDKTFWLPLQRTKGNPDLYDDPQLDANGYKNGRCRPWRQLRRREGQQHPGHAHGRDARQLVGHRRHAHRHRLRRLHADLRDGVRRQRGRLLQLARGRGARRARSRTTSPRASSPPAGQDSLPSNDYDALPASIYAIAKTGVDAIGWNKGGRGRPCDGAQPQPAAHRHADPGWQHTRRRQPAPISNAFTIASARVSGTTIRLSLQLPGAGKIAVASSTKPKKGKTITLPTKTVTVTKSGAQTVTREPVLEGQERAQEGQEAQGHAEDHLHPHRRHGEDDHEDRDRQAGQEALGR